MKKIISFVCIVVSVMIIVSCVGKKSETVVNVEGVEITTEDLDELVKIAAEVEELADERIDIKLLNGSVVLSPEMKLIKPDYLVEPASLVNLETMSSKISAIGILLVDKAVADAYDMSTDEYEAVIARLFTETNFNIPFVVKKDDLKDLDWTNGKESIIEYFKNQKTAESWEKELILLHAMAMEALYIGNQNSVLTDKFYTPEMIEASEKSISKIVYALEKIAPYSESVSDIVKLRQEVGKQFIEETADAERRKELERTIMKAQAFSNAIRMGMLAR